MCWAVPGCVFFLFIFCLPSSFSGIHQTFIVHCLDFNSSSDFLCLLSSQFFLLSPIGVFLRVSFRSRPALLSFPTFLFGSSSHLHLFPHQRSCRRLGRCRVGWVCLHPVPFFLPRPCYTLSLLSSAFRTFFSLVHPIILVFFFHSPSSSVFSLFLALPLSSFFSTF